MRSASRSCRSNPPGDATSSSASILRAADQCSLRGQLLSHRVPKFFWGSWQTTRDELVKDQEAAAQAAAMDQSRQSALNQAKKDLVAAQARLDGHYSAESRRALDWAKPEYQPGRVHWPTNGPQSSRLVPCRHHCGVQRLGRSCNAVDAAKLLKRCAKGEREFQQVDLIGTNLEGVNLARANLQQSNVARANLSRTNLEGAKLSCVNLEQTNLAWVNLEGANLKGTNLEGANLKGARFTNANLEEADLEGARLEEARFSGAKLTRTNFAGAHLEKATLSGTKLGEANLEESNLEEASLRIAYLERAHLERARLSYAEHPGLCPPALGKSPSRSQRHCR